ncbi:CheR family methyltransferase [Candidatus Magnetaquicoccus inordinatus]|uniref:CheR family methyltransferase n=1 Tax=Candidatus Magnetaquicoccus inordinatus TaxID=2496818 RepID=UPI00102C6AB6|nr:CheR family methyltransferase [Candidatus Magnetaquicoccus inordinatus]
MILPRIEQLVEQHSGLTFQGERKKNLQRAVEERMGALSLQQASSYAEILEQQSQERENLISLLTVNETYFMREPAQIHFVVNRLLPELIHSSKQRQEIVILSAGCATGEEPYSLAIALYDKFAQTLGHFVRIIGIDVDVKALAIAKEAIYGRNSFRGNGHDFLQKHFTRLHDQRYQLNENYRKLVTFHNCNILNRQDMLRLAIQADIIFYRNVSIYFEEPARRAIFANFASLLQPPGYVVVSSVESMLHDFGIFHLLEEDGLFFFQKEAPTSHQALGRLNKQFSQLNKLRQKLPTTKRFAPGDSGIFPSHSTEEQTVPGRLKGKAISAGLLPENSRAVAADASARRAGSNLVSVAEHRNSNKSVTGAELENSLQNALVLAQQQNYAQALQLVERCINSENIVENVDAQSLQAGLLLELQRFAEAKDLCRRILVSQPWHIEARMLLGIMAKRGGEHEEALQQFKEVSFLNPHNWLAHYYLAESYQQLQRKPQAVRAYRVTVNILSKQGMGKTGLTLFAPFCTTEQLLHLCNKQIVHLMG